MDERADIKKIVEKFENSKIILLNFKDWSGSNLDQQIAKIIKHLVNDKKMKCIYISIRNPSNYLIEIFKSFGINLSNILFIDVISQYVYVSSPEILVSSKVKIEEKLENVIMLNSPFNLTELGILFLEISSSFKETRNVFIVFDSLDSILLYVDREKFLKFFHFFVSKLKMFKTLGIFIFSKEKESIIEDIKYLVDEIFVLIEK